MTTPPSSPILLDEPLRTPIGGGDGEDTYSTVLHLGTTSYVVHGDLTARELDTLISVFARCERVVHKSYKPDEPRYLTTKESLEPKVEWCAHDQILSPEVGLSEIDKSVAAYGLHLTQFLSATPSNTEGEDHG